MVNKQIELYKKQAIIKETQKAVFIKAKEMTKEDYDLYEKLQSLNTAKYRRNKNGYWQRIDLLSQIKENGFWIPKSQITINNNYITHIAKWLYNELSDTYYNFPTISMDAYNELKKEIN